jgi:hypothetical protein
MTPPSRLLRRVTHQVTVLWPISLEGRIEGENIYAGERHGVIRRLAPGKMSHLGPPERQQK